MENMLKMLVKVIKCQLVKNGRVLNKNIHFERSNTGVQDYFVLFSLQYNHRLMPTRVYIKKKCN